MSFGGHMQSALEPDVTKSSVMEHVQYELAESDSLLQISYAKLVQLHQPSQLPELGTQQALHS